MKKLIDDYNTVKPIKTQTANTKKGPKLGPTLTSVTTSVPPCCTQCTPGLCNTAWSTRQLTGCTVLRTRASPAGLVSTGGTDTSLNTSVTTASVARVSW